MNWSLVDVVSYLFSMWIYWLFVSACIHFFIGKDRDMAVIDGVIALISCTVFYVVSLLFN